MAHLHLVDNKGQAHIYNSDLVFFVVATENGVEAGAIVEGVDTMRIFDAAITLERLHKDILDKTAGGKFYELYREAASHIEKEDASKNEHSREYESLLEVLGGKRRRRPSLF